MKRGSGSALALVALLGWSGAASASGGISCDVDDDNMVMSLSAGVTRGMGSPVFSFKAQATLKAKDVADDLRETDFERTHLAQYWLGDGEMKMILYREREGDKPHGYVEIVLRTTGDEEGYKGEYALSVFDVPATGDQKEYQAAGMVSCFVE